MKSSIIFYTVLLCIVAVSSFPIQGAWKLTAIGTTDIPSNYLITMTINDFIFRNQSIRWSMQFSGCRTFKYLMQIEANHIFIDIDTFFLSQTTANIQKIQCSDQQQTIEASLISKIKQIFTFQIISSYMVISNAQGKVVLKFQRYLNAQTIKITGNWLIQSLQGEKFNQIIEINEQSFLFCQKKAKIKYSLNQSQNNRIILSNLTDQGCGFKKLIIGIQKIQFFRHFLKTNAQGNETRHLQLYSSQDKLILNLYYLLDLQTANKLKQQQDLIKAQQDKQRLARIQQLREQQRQRILRERAQNLSQAQSTQQQSVVRVATIIAGEIGDLEGQWQVVSIFKMPNFIQSLEFLVTSGNFILSGGCNTHIILYKSGPKPGTLQIGNLRSGRQVCTVNDDGLFISGLQKIQQYTVKIVDKFVIAYLRDSAGNLVYELKKPVQFQTIIVQSQKLTIQQPPSSPSKLPTIPTVGTITKPIPASAPVISVTAPVPISRLFSSDRALLLLLKRRDIVRKFIDIDHQKQLFTFSLCKKLSFSYSFSSATKKLTIKLVNKQSTSDTANCISAKQQQQNSYIQYLSGVTSYRIAEDGSMYFSNQKDGDIIAVTAY